MGVGAEETKAVIESYIRAWQTNDKQLLLSLFAEDASWEDPVGSPAFVGLEGVARFWDFAHVDESRTLTPVPHQIIACGNEGVLNFTMQVRIPTTNQGLDLAVIDQFVLNDQGRIKSAKAYWDEQCVSCPEGMDLFIPDIEGA